MSDICSRLHVDAPDLASGRSGPATGRTGPIRMQGGFEMPEKKLKKFERAVDENSWSAGCPA
ncbi:hypothetical protein [Methylobacterium indicum]|uniref:hypothetical protein n=1 Tax=Methylobacterium indicum TaxID=1775910 RepID=UPI002434FBF4|nr:hypothetical protein [Methylobacterium indicum]